MEKVLFSFYGSGGFLDFQAVRRRAEAVADHGESLIVRRDFRLLQMTLTMRSETAAFGGYAGNILAVHKLLKQNLSPPPLAPLAVKDIAAASGLKIIYIIAGGCLSSLSVAVRKYFAAGEEVLSSLIKIHLLIWCCLCRSSNTLHVLAIEPCHHKCFSSLFISIFIRSST
ncbi:membrane protein [Salvia divinorum]|uniref:Membrane protein n=1 Tax=Salvia divinorum TaxID=28513 RepID=A0ABD1FK77_SALDI